VSNGWDDVVGEGVYTSVQIELHVRVLFAFGAVIVWSTFDAEKGVSYFRNGIRGGWTYTWTFRNCNEALGDWALKTTLTAMTAATAKATEVKKPKTFWIRVRLLCIFNGLTALLSRESRLEHRAYVSTTTHVRVRVHKAQ